MNPGYVNALSETNEQRGQTNCYTGACPECGQVLAVTVAPVNEPDTLERALKDRRGWIRDGLTAGTCIVADVWEGRVALAHTGTCVTGQRQARRDQKRAVRS